MTAAEKLHLAALAVWAAASLAKSASEATAPEAMAEGMKRALARLHEGQAYLAWLELDERTRTAGKAPGAHQDAQGSREGVAKAFLGVLTQTKGVVK